VSDARNAALDAFTDHDLVQLDDDVSEIGEFVPLANGKNRLSPLSQEQIRERFELCFQYVKAVGTVLWGVSPTSNPIFYNPKFPISPRSFINGSCSGYVSKTPVRFDSALALKEDYDYTLKVLMTYGAVVRFNSLYGKARHRDNAGGACAYRTTELEQEAICLLRSRWGKMIRKHPTRANEVVIHCG